MDSGESRERKIGLDLCSVLVDIYTMPNAIGSPPTGAAVGHEQRKRKPPMKMSIESASRLLAAAHSGSEWPAR